LSEEFINRIQHICPDRQAIFEKIVADRLPNDGSSRQRVFNYIRRHPTRSAALPARSVWVNTDDHLPYITNNILNILQVFPVWVAKSFIVHILCQDQSSPNGRFSPAIQSFSVRSASVRAQR
jgi:hypothetical protein